jgi:ADP-dependent phosphofructokinase/glucokinase
MFLEGILIMKPESIVLGLGNNIDYEIIWDSKSIEQLIVKFRISESELRTDLPIYSVRNLIISLLGFITTGEGGERFVEVPEIIEEFSLAFDKKVTIGGTSIRSAIAMSKIGYTSAIHFVTLNTYVYDLVPPGCSWICSNDKETLYPHLIIQFNKNTVIKAGDINISSPRANRIIYDNDPDNIIMKINPDLKNFCRNAEVFLISGFNAMQSELLLSQRLDTLSDILDSLPQEAWVFYEDACFHKISLIEMIHEKLLEKIDIYSMNEDEMQGYLGRKIDLLSPVNVYSALNELKKIFPTPLIVLHTRYWALAYGKHANKFQTSLKGGITMATTRFIFGDEFSEDNYVETKNLPCESTAVSFSHQLNLLGGEMICCLPSVEVQENNVTTIGLGDAFVGGFLPTLLKITKHV